MGSSPGSRRPAEDTDRVDNGARAGGARAPPIYRRRPKSLTGRKKPVMCCDVKFRLSRTSTLLLGSILGILLTLPVLAYASPPDPTWIAGLWDDADYDDVVILITSTSGIADANPFVEVKPLLFLVASLPPVDLQPDPAPASSLRHSRAPPAA